MMCSIFYNMAHNFQQMENQGTMAAPNFDPIVGYLKLFPVIMIVFTGTLLGWQWSVAIGLQKMVPAGIKMKVTMFKIFFFIPVIYISLIMIFAFFVLNAKFFNFANPESFAPQFFIAFAVIFPVHLFSMFCLFYCIYFVSKTFKTVELQREVTFSDHVAEFFLTWFYPVGVWIMQPKINKMIAEYNAGSGDEV
jgi:hypothetical protein